MPLGRGSTFPFAPWTIYSPSTPFVNPRHKIDIDIETLNWLLSICVSSLPKGATIQSKTSQLISSFELYKAPNARMCVGVAPRSLLEARSHPIGIGDPLA